MKQQTPVELQPGNRWIEADEIENLNLEADLDF